MASTPYPRLGWKNLTNALLCATAAWPSFFATSWFFSTCFPPHAAQDTPSLCSSFFLSSPFVTTNFLYFWNVSVGFWLVGLAQGSFWLIDPYWTIIPVLIASFYHIHPMSLDSQGLSPSVRPHVVLALVWLWSLRLTHSYFRREEWKFGEREDWRYAKMARDHPRSWWILSFFSVGVAQQPMLLGITLPLYSVNFVPGEWGILDNCATVLCIVGIVIAWMADNQLYDYMKQKNTDAVGKSSPGLLRLGLWKYSRHPNYFGEQLFWWSLGLYSVGLGHWWCLFGALINSMVLAIVTVMTEDRVMKGWTPDRARLYKKYQETTSVWVPLPTTWEKHQ